MSKIPLPILLATGVLGGGSLPAPTFDLTATTTAPSQTVTLQQITPSGKAVTVDWGDGTTEVIADGNTLVKSHEYATAGAYTIRLPYVEYATINIQDSKVGGTVTASNPFPAVTSSIYLSNLPNLTWVVSTDNPFPAVTDSVSIQLMSNLTWTVSSTSPFPSVTVGVSLRYVPNLTWTVDAANPFPPVTQTLSIVDMSNLIWTVDAANPFPQVTSFVTLRNIPGLVWDSGAAANLHSVNSIQYENNLLAGAVDTVLDDLYGIFPLRTKVGTIDMLGGGNAAPTGVSPGSAECPPTTGWNTAYELVNDTCGISDFHWTSVSLQT